MCDFCKNVTKWNTDDYALVSDRGLFNGIMMDEDGTYQIGTFNSSHDYWDVLDITFCPICGRKLVE